MESLPPELAQNLQLTMETGVPTMLVQDGMKMEEQQTKNQPTIEVCDYDNLVIDPSCRGNLEEAGFIAFEFETSRAKLEKDGRYTNLDDVNWQGNSITNKSEATEQITTKTSVHSISGTTLGSSSLPLSIGGFGILMARAWLSRLSQYGSAIR
jgi:hypothetical protein